MTSYLSVMTSFHNVLLETVSPTHPYATFVTKKAVSEGEMFVGGAVVYQIFDYPLCWLIMHVSILDLL